MSEHKVICLSTRKPLPEGDAPPPEEQIQIDTNSLAVIEEVKKTVEEGRGEGVLAMYWSPEIGDFVTGMALPFPMEAEDLYRMLGGLDALKAELMGLYMDAYDEEGL